MWDGGIRVPVVAGRVVTFGFFITGGVESLPLALALALALV